MKKIGVLFGIENSFPSALVASINARNLSGIQAEFAQIGAIALNSESRYTVLVDRISHEVPFYRAVLKRAALEGAAVLNNPFWASADEKFVNYSIARELGIDVPPTVLLPHKLPPNNTTGQSLRNLEYPLDWESVFAYVGEHGYLKPVDGGGWRDVREVGSRDEFFQAYDESGQLCMVYQKAIEHSAYVRCFVAGANNVRVMNYDPDRPHAERYPADAPKIEKKLLKKIEADALKLCAALGYEVNTVEFAIQDGVAYAIDFFNPVPDADLHSVGAENFQWIVDAVADLAIAKAKEAPLEAELKSYALLGAQSNAAKPAKVEKAAKPAKSAAKSEAKPAAKPDAKPAVKKSAPAKKAAKKK